VDTGVAGGFVYYGVVTVDKQRTTRRVPPDRRAAGQGRGRPSNEERVMAETYSGEFYCVKCKEKREASGEVHVNDKGTRMAKAKCPVCGTNLNRILGKA
jgi:Domain of unknown function (DUF5679)